MKTGLISFYSLTIFIFGSFSPRHLCVSPSDIDCITDLAHHKFYLIKRFTIPFTEESRTIQHSYVLTKGTRYMISLCFDSDQSKGVLVTVYNNKRSVVASNDVNGELLSTLIYECSAPGIYYFEYCFTDLPINCYSTLGFAPKK